MILPVKRGKWAAQPIFFCSSRTEAVAGTQQADFAQLLERTLAPMGYELVDWEMSPRGRTIRVFIDVPKGVDVEDCARVSNQLTRLFAVENIDFDRLEVSSPGLDRPLKKAADFDRFAGEEAELRLHSPIETPASSRACCVAAPTARLHWRLPRAC